MECHNDINSVSGETGGGPERMDLPKEFGTNTVNLRDGGGPERKELARKVDWAPLKSTGTMC
jgi:hypothetical protein